MKNESAEKVQKGKGDLMILSDTSVRIIVTDDVERVDRLAEMNRNRGHRVVVKEKVFYEIQIERGVHEEMAKAGF